MATYKRSTRAIYEADWRRRKAISRKKGERGKYVGRGRFAEKEGGQQVAAFFAECSDNDKIKHIYGNYGFWAWLRYWYLDSVNFITMQLIDKGYYDYDFKSVEKPDVQEQLTMEATVKSEEETHNILAMFGWKPKPKPTDAATRSANDMTADELQQMAINELNKRKSK